MNRETQLHDIYIKLNSEWVPISINSSSESFKQYATAYMQYKNRPMYHRETAYEEDNGISVYRENNGHYNPTYILDRHSDRHSDRQHVFPVIDMADVKVFLTDVANSHANWFKARDYQAWAYRDFMYDETKPQVKYYASRHSSHLFFQTTNYRDVVTIELDGLSPNIIFKLSRNENGSVYYEKNDRNASRIRICDCETARSGYLGYYQRITDVTNFIIIPPVASAASENEYQDFTGYLHEINATAALTASYYQNHSIKLPLTPGTYSVQTDNEEEQCIMCFKNKSTLRLHPCGHKVMCPDCYHKMEKGECPICRSSIIKLTCENS
jgi:hypothetical protein